MKPILLLLVIFSSQAFASLARSSLVSQNNNDLNCLNDLEDGYQVNICKNVIDTSKVKTINCLAELEDGYQTEICMNSINPATQSRLNCLSPQDGYEHGLCLSVPDPKSIQFINCLGSLEDGYQVGICENVNVQIQKSLWARIAPEGI